MNLRTFNLHRDCANSYFGKCKRTLFEPNWVVHHVSPRKMYRTIFTSCSNAQIVPSIIQVTLRARWSVDHLPLLPRTLLSKLLCCLYHFVTSVILLPVLLYCLCCSVISATLLFLLPCYFCYFVTSITLLLWYFVTSATLLLLLPCFLCYLPTQRKAQLRRIQKWVADAPECGCAASKNAYMQRELCS